MNVPTLSWQNHRETIILAEFDHHSPLTCPPRARVLCPTQTEEQKEISQLRDLVERLRLRVSDYEKKLPAELLW